MSFSKRKSPRIPNYDYSQENYYFITVCTHKMQCIFGSPEERNLFGAIAERNIQQISKHFPNIKVDKYVVMPNHVHAIVVVEAGAKVGLSEVVGLYKSGVTRQIRKLDPAAVVWQRSFHDHIIRNQQDYERIWQYIHGNPQRWDEDCFYCKVF